LKIDDSIPESKYLKKFLVEPFTTWSRYLNKIYNPNKSNDLKVFQRWNLKMVMWVVDKDNKEWQRYMEERYCDKALCVKNDNWDLLIYPNLAPYMIENFNLFNCTWNWEKFKCYDNKAPKWIAQPKKIPVDDLPNDTPTPIGPHPEDWVKFFHLPSFWEEIKKPSTDTCWNWKVDPREECDTTAGWPENDSSICNAPWTLNECKYKKQNPNQDITEDTIILPPKDTNKPVEKTMSEELYCWWSPGKTFTISWVVYKVVSIKPIKRSFKRKLIPQSWKDYDIILWTWYVNIIGETSTWAKYVKKMKLAVEIKRYYYKFWDFDWDWQFDWTSFSQLILDKLDNKNVKVDINKLVIQDKEKVTAPYNMKKLLNEYFENTDWDDNLVIEKKNFIWDTKSDFTIPWEVCKLNGKEFSIFYYKKNWDLTTFPNLQPINVSFPNLVIVEKLNIKNVVNSNAVIKFPSLEKVPLLLKIENVKAKEISMPVLKEVWGRIWDAIELKVLTPYSKTFLQTYKYIRWYFIKNSTIDTLNQTSLERVWKNLDIQFSNINTFKNNLKEIIPLIDKWVNGLSKMWIWVLSREIIYNWEWVLMFKDDWTHHLPYNSFHNLKTIWALLFMWIKNQKINLDSLDWIYYWIFFRNSNNNDVSLLWLSKLWIILANNQISLENVDECSDDYVKQFRAWNFSNWDFENSSNNVIHHWRLRYVAFTEDKFSWPFLEWLKKYTNPKATHIWIAPAYDMESVWNKIDMIQNTTCVWKEWKGTIWNQWLYFYDDSNDWTSPWYSLRYDWIGYFWKIVKMQKYMYVKRTHFERDMEKNKKHIEFIYNIPLSKKVSAKTLYQLALSLPKMNIPKVPEWLWEITQDWKEGSVIIELWKPLSSWWVTYTAYTPKWTYWGSVCSPNIEINYYCVKWKIYEKDIEYDSCSVTWETITTILYDWPYQTRSSELPTCTISKKVCLAETDYKDALFYSWAKNSDWTTWEFLWTTYQTWWCIVIKDYCKWDDYIVEYYKNDKIAPENLFDTKIYPKWCLKEEKPTVIPKPEPPTKTVDVLTYLWATDLIINENSPAIHTEDWTVYWLSNLLWLSKIDTAYRKWWII
jgi:hypothetical protein